MLRPWESRHRGTPTRLYGSLEPRHYTDGQITERLVEQLKAGGELSPSLLFNTFENVTFVRSSEMSVYRSHIIKIGATNVHLAGSGPALFTLVKDRVEAEDLHVRLQQQGMECYLAETVTAVERVE